jgi:hypothetical protein
MVFLVVALFFCCTATFDFFDTGKEALMLLVFLRFGIFGYLFDLEKVRFENGYISGPGLSSHLFWSLAPWDASQFGRTMDL